jgi:hypothetical protein
MCIKDKKLLNSLNQLRDLGSRGDEIDKSNRCVDTEDSYQ